jgi:hypothetical protein
MRTPATLLLAALLAFAPALGQCAKVYKWTDAQGNVIYSDTPRPGAEEIEILTDPAGIAPVRPEQMPQSKPQAPGEIYGSVIIAAPAQDQVIEDPAGWVNVSLAVEPPLRVSQGDAVRLKLDGQTLDARYTGSEIAIPSVPRGTHTLQAEIVNPAGNALIASAAVTFHVHAPSAQAPAGPDIYDPVYPAQPYPPTYRPVYPPQPYPPQGRPKPAPVPR